MSRGGASILQGSIFVALTKFSIPILFSLILQALYGAVDLWMVSRFGVTADVSAVSTGSQTMLIVTGLITGLAMGVTVLLGQAVGEGNDQRSAHIIGTSLWVFGGVALMLTVLLLLGAPALTGVLHAPAEAFDKTIHYMRICGLGTLFVVGFNVFSSIFCGLGDAKTPLIFVMIACIFNILGDYILIAHFDLGTVGAALATVLAQAISVVTAVDLLKKRLPFRLERQHFVLEPALFAGIFKLGTPVALLRMCNEVSYLLIIGFVNTLGVVASSGVGIAEKLVMFILLIPTAYMSAVSAFVAQNTGAGQHPRAKRCLWVGMATAAVVGGVFFYISFFHGDTLSALFISDGPVIQASAEFLKATALECLILSLAYCYDGYFNGIGKTTFVMVQGILAALCVRIPYAYYASTRPDHSLFNIGLSTALAAAFMLIVCTVYYCWWTRKTTHS